MTSFLSGLYFWQEPEIGNRRVITVMENLLQVGIISSTHGVRGEVKVFPTTDDIKRFGRLKEVLLDTGKENIILQIEGVKYFKQFAILKFKEFDNINEVEKYKGKGLFISRENAVPLKKDEYFIADLIGIRAENEDASFQGVLKDVIETGANDVYVIETDQGKEVLIPAIKECILSIDISAGEMKVHLLEGLLD